jgi:hypothetical protein
LLKRIFQNPRKQSIASEEARRVIVTLARNSAIRINQETGQAIGLFRRTSLAGIGIGIDDLTFK